MDDSTFAFGKRLLKALGVPDDWQVLNLQIAFSFEFGECRVSLDRLRPDDGSVLVEELRQRFSEAGDANIDRIIASARKDSRTVSGSETRALCDEIERLRAQWT